MSGRNVNRAGLTGLETVLIVISVVLIIALAVVWSFYTQLSGAYASLQNQYNTLQTQYNSLQEQYSSLQNQYNSLNSEYSSLQNQYNALQNEYSTLQNSYNALQSEYNNLEQEYNSLYNEYMNDTEFINGLVSGMTWTDTEYIFANDFRLWGLVYVPSYCQVVGVLTVSASGPVDIYVGDWISAMYYYTYQAGVSAYQGTWTWIYQWSGTSYVNQTVSFTTTYVNGDYFMLVVYNPNNYGVNVEVTFTPLHIYC